MISILMQELASSWQRSPLPDSWLKISSARAALLSTAARQIELKAQSNIPYNPLHCPIFRWCSQWLDVAEGNRRSIDGDVEFLFHVIMDPAPLSKQALAAGERPDPET